MVKKHNLSLSAAQIDENLVKAGQAVLFTEQNLTPEQQAQARKNLGITESNINTTSVGVIGVLNSFDGLVGETGQIGVYT